MDEPVASSQTVQSDTSPSNKLVDTKRFVLHDFKPIDVGLAVELGMFRNYV
jgi:hypothetical protein